jgi:gas vesicle protein
MRFRTIALLAAGAATAYFLDPDSGRRRRAQLRDKLEGRAKDMRTRHVVVAEARSAVERRRTQRAQPDRRDPTRPVDIDLS